MNRYPELRASLATGDVLLFSGRGIIPWVIQRATRSPYSHVGMVVKVEGWDLCMCWESTTLNDVADADSGAPVSGVQFDSLSERVAKFKGGIVVRKLLKPMRAHGVRDLMAMRKTLIGRPYERRLWTLAMAALWPKRLKAEDLSSLFCSELVAEAYQRLGIILKGLPPADAYVPADFADVPKPRYRHMAGIFGPEITLKS